jgi:pimeloyl-ACP methyl ester carboxylesterase
MGAKPDTVPRVRAGPELIAAVTGGPLPAHVRVRAGSLSLHCLDWGAGDASAVLLVHGNGGHAHWWDALVPWLAGYRLVAPDLRGHGESDWSAEPAYRVDDFRADLLAALDGLGLARVTMIAHSMGARAAAWFAAHHPERVRGLAMLDTTLVGVDAETALRYRGSVQGQRRGRAYESYDAAVAAFRFVPPEPNVAPAIVSDLAHHAVHERAPGEWAYRFDRAVLSMDGDDAGDLTDVVAGLDCPIWVGCGTTSALTPRAEFERLQRRRPALELHHFAGAHHFFLSYPRAAGEALRAWLDGCA